MSKVLILNGSISEIPIIQKAKAMGHYVVTRGKVKIMYETRTFPLL